ncbi:MAG: hypothetical protein R3B09_23285 [Nannocystaceae bacterium]
MRLALTVLALSTALCACTVAPGDYVIVRVASADQEVSMSCYGGNPVDKNIAEDTSDLRAAGSFALFAADKENFFLEIDHGDGLDSIAGVRDGKDYSFEGTSVNVDYPFNPQTMAEDKQTTTTQYQTDMTIAGHDVSGRDVVTISCTGYACPYASCVVTTEFVGTVVRDVELEHGI